MPFAVGVKNGDEFAEIQGPTQGVSAHGKKVKLENIRLELADPADADKLTIAAHSDGAPGHFTATPVDGFELGDETSHPVSVKYIADGRPGEDVKDISDDGIVSILAPDAATFDGDVTGSAQPV